MVGHVALLLVLAPAVSSAAAAKDEIDAITEKDVERVLGPLSDRDLDTITAACSGPSDKDQCAKSMKGLEKQLVDRFLIEKELLAQFAEQVSVMQTELVSLRSKFAHEVSALSVKITELKNQSLVQDKKEQAAEAKEQAAEAKSKALEEQAKQVQASTVKAFKLDCGEDFKKKYPNGVAYRNSQNLEDVGSSAQRWGSIVMGSEVGDGWVRVEHGDGKTEYLPMKVHGSAVISEIPAKDTQPASLASIETRLEELRRDMIGSKDQQKSKDDTSCSMEVVRHCCGGPAAVQQGSGQQMAPEKRRHLALSEQARRKVRKNNPLVHKNNPFQSPHRARPWGHAIDDDAKDSHIVVNMPSDQDAGMHILDKKDEDMTVLERSEHRNARSKGKSKGRRAGRRGQKVGPLGKNPKLFEPAVAGLDETSTQEVPDPEKKTHTPQHAGRGATSKQRGSTRRRRRSSGIAEP